MSGQRRARPDGPFVNVDAAYRDGHAGLAQVGHPGIHSRRVCCASSIEAELRALLCAMQVAQDRGEQAITFRVDCASLLARTTSRDGRNPSLADLRANVRGLLGRYPRWSIDRIPRRQNAAANTLARKALYQRTEEAAA